MDIFQIIILVTVVVGIVMIVISLLSIQNGSNASSYFEGENAIKVVEKSLAELDSATEEFSNTSNAIFKELDEKYQELLFIYSLIDEKRQEVAEIYTNINNKTIRNIENDVNKTTRLNRNVNTNSGIIREPQRKVQAIRADKEVLSSKKTSDYVEGILIKGNIEKDEKNNNRLDKESYLNRTDANNVEKLGAKAAYENEKLTSINNLIEQGMSIPEIAKRLDMGQGEIRLMLELSRGR